MPRTHDDYVDDLVNLIKDSYLVVIKKQEYKFPYLMIGDIDVLAIDYNKMDFYEVKGGNDRGTMKKAVDQLKKARSYLGHQGREFVYTPRNGIEPIEKIIDKLRRNRKRQGRKPRMRDDRKKTRRRN